MKEMKQERGKGSKGGEGEEGWKEVERNSKWNSECGSKMNTERQNRHCLILIKSRTPEWDCGGALSRGYCTRRRHKVTSYWNSTCEEDRLYLSAPYRVALALRVHAYLGTNLVAALASLQVDNFTHFAQEGRTLSNAQTDRREESSLCTKIRAVRFYMLRNAREVTVMLIRPMRVQAIFSTYDVT